MKELFRLEFNEEQQFFHSVYDKHTPENTKGWITITDWCTDDEFHILEAYLHRKEKDKLTIEYILKSFHELKKFISNLHEYKMEIKNI